MLKGSLGFALTAVGNQQGVEQHHLFKSLFKKSPLMYIQGTFKEGAFLPIELREILLDQSLGLWENQ